MTQKILFTVNPFFKSKFKCALLLKAKAAALLRGADDFLRHFWVIFFQNLSSTGGNAQCYRNQV